MSPRFRRAGIAMSLAAALPLSAGCIGQFAAFNKLLRWNQNLGNKWVNWVVFLGLSIIPVYWVAIAADALVFNSLEFWTGNNPMGSVQLPNTKITTSADGTQQRLDWTPETHTLRIETRRPGEEPRVLVVAFGDDRAEVRDGAGALLSTAELRDGGLEVRDAKGALLFRRSAAEVRELADSAQRGPAAVLAAVDALQPGLAFARR